MEVVPHPQRSRPPGRAGGLLVGRGAQRARTLSMMRSNGEAWSNIAETIGYIVGTLISQFIDKLAFVVNVVGGSLASIFAMISHAVEFVANVMAKDWKAANESLLNIFKELAVWIVDMGAALIEFAASMLDLIPGMGGMAESARSMADSMRSGARDALGIVEYWEGGKETLDKISETLDDIERKEKSAQQTLEEAVRQDLVKKSALDDINNLTAYEVEQNEDLTAEMKEQLLWLIKIQEYKERLKVLDDKIVAIQDAVTDNKVAERDATKRIESINNKRLLIMGEIQGMELGIAQGLRESTSQAEQLAEAQEAAADEAREYLNTLRRVSGELMDEVADAVEDQIDAEKDAIENSFRVREARMKDYFERKNDEVDKAADAEVGQIEAIEKKEKELDAMREFHFQREKMRIEFLENKAVGNIEMRTAIAEGELDQAAIIRERLFRQDEEFLQESAKMAWEQEAEKRQGVLDEKKNEIEQWRDAEKEKLEIQEESAEKRLEAEKDAALKAHERRAELIKRDLEVWKEVTPASEEEYKKHLGNLERLLRDKYGVNFKNIVDQFQRNTGNALTSGFAVVRDKVLSILAEESKWKSAIKSAMEAGMEGAKEAAEKGIRDLGKLYGLTDGLNYANLDNDMIRAIQNAMGPNPTGPVVRHQGGVIPYTGGAPGLMKDEVPAVLQSGEYVIKRDTVRSLGVNFLDDLNRGGAKFHDGGLVNIMAGRALGALSNVGLMMGMMAGSGMGGMMGLGGMAPGRFTGSYGRYTRGEIAANTAAAQRFLKSSWDIPHGVAASLNRRDPKSDHGKGKALDVMTASLGKYSSKEGMALGNAVAQWFINNDDIFGTKYVIWNGRIANGSIGNWKWRDYWGRNMGATQGHYDHVHLSFLHDGGLAGDAPKFRWGGKLKKDSMINAHKGEYVVRQPLAAKFEQMMDGGARVGGNTYNFEFNGVSDNMDEKALARMVVREIEQHFSLGVERRAAKSRRRSPERAVPAHSGVLTDADYFLNS